MKQIFYLNDNPEFFESHEKDYEPITWIWKWEGKTVYSMALHELMNEFYNLN